MLEYLILGFLMYGDMNGYLLKQAIEGGPSYFSNVSFGSLYPALARLEKKGYVSMKQVEDGKRLKKNYHLLPEGEALFMSWLKSPIESARNNEAFLSKVFFYEFIDPEEAEMLLNRFIEDAQGELQVLNGISSHVEEHSSRFQFGTLAFGQGYYSFLIHWVSQFIQQISSFPREDRLRYQKLLKGEDL